MKQSKQSDINVKHLRFFFAPAALEHSTQYLLQNIFKAC